MKNKKTHKRWKGGSGSSNPLGTKFRDAVKRRFFKESGVPSALTVKALQAHDGGDANEASEMELDANFESKTFNTWATNFTQCTNLTFGRVHTLWNSNNAQHKEMLALLASLTEIIKEKSGKGTDLEYFAALISYLDNVESEESATAAAVLLSLAVKKVPLPALKAQFANISKTLVDSICKYVQSESTSLLKSLLVSLGCTLKAQDAGCWNVSSTNNSYKTLLHFTVHSKPRVRKSAQKAVETILKASSFLFLPDAPLCHPAAVPTSKFCISTIEESIKQGVTEVDALHVLSLLQDVVATFPRSQIEKCCETLLRLMYIKKPVVKSNAMAALYGLFSQHPPSTSLPFELNAQIINALHDCQPAENDSGLMPGWLAVMEQAHVNLCKLNVAVFMDHLPRLFTVAMACVLSHQKDVRTSAVKLMNLLLKESIGSETQSLAEKRRAVNAGDLEVSLQKLVRALEAGLSYQYHSNWDLVFQLLGTSMEVLGKICPKLLEKCLVSVADLRDSAGFSYKTDADVVIGKAIKSMGPHTVLNVVPLKVTGTEDLPDLSRSWLFPVIRDNVSDTELSTFETVFLPLAVRFRDKAKELADRQQNIIAKTYETLESQVWSMLKGFCTRPTDLAKSFKRIAQMLGMTLRNRPDLQMDIMASLRMLVNFSRNSDADKAAMSHYSKNYLPILFNLFLTETESLRDSRRLAVLETVKIYFTITDPKLLYFLANDSVAKIADKDATVFKKIALTDLIIAMVKHTDKPLLATFYTLAQDLVKSADKRLQKKAFRILEEICMCHSEACEQFLSSNIDHLQQVLLESLSASAPSTKTPRLRCLTCISKHLVQPNKLFIQAVVPEAILCTRGVGERVRAAAYELILEIAETMMRWNPDAEKQDVLSGYVNLVIAGLSGSPEMISGTLLVLTSIMCNYKGDLSADTLLTILEVVFLLTTSERREVVKACLEFIRTLIGAYDRDILCAHLPEMVTALASIKNHAKKSCHPKVKLILKKLIKKFGFEAVLKLTPQKIHIVLQKAQSEVKQDQKKKEKEKAEQEQAEDDDDSDTEVVKQKPETVEEVLQFSDSEEDEPKQESVKKIKKRSTFIKEEEGDILDILDKSAAKKVVASKPKPEVEKTLKEEKDGGFKIAPDGRLIISEPKEEQDKNVGSDAEEDLDDLMTAIEGGSEKKRRKRLREASKYDDEEEEPQNKYRPGGSGIHRSLEQKDSGSEYRAKKAGGDIKKKGTFEPYSYERLNIKTLNKRNRSKLKTQSAGKGSKRRR